MFGASNAPYMHPKPGRFGRVFICVQTNDCQSNFLLRYHKFWAGFRNCRYIADTTSSAQIVISYYGITEKSGA